MKKSIYLMTLGLFVGVITLSSCGGGEDEAAKKHIADSLATVHMEDSLMQIHIQDSLKQAHVVDSMMQVHIEDSLALLKKPTHTTTTVVKNVPVIPKGTTQTGTAKPNTGGNTGGKIPVKPANPNNGGTGGKIKVK